MMKRTLLVAAALAGLSAPALAAGETPVPPQLVLDLPGSVREVRPRPAAARLQGLPGGLRLLPRPELHRLPQPRRARRPGILRGAGPRARGRIQDPGRPERRRRHVRAARPAGRPLPVAVPERERRRGGERRQGPAGPVADGEGAHLRARLPVVRPRRLPPVFRERRRLPRRAARTATRSRRRASRSRRAATTTSTIPATSSRCRSPSATGRSSTRRGRTAQPPVPETVDQYARDVTAFLAWTAEPHLEARKRLGFQVMLFLSPAGGPALLHEEEGLGQRRRRGRGPCDPADDA